MKHVILVIGLVIFVGGICAGGGYWFGQKQKSEFDECIPVFTAVLTEATTSWKTLYLLDNGRVDEAKESLNVSLDGFIGVINTMLKVETDAENIKGAKNFLRQMKLHREKFPYKSSDEDMKKSNKKTQTILDKIEDQCE